MKQKRKRDRPLRGELIPLVGIVKTVKDIIKKEPNVISEWWKNEKTIDTWKAGAVAGYQIAFLMLLIFVLVKYVF